MDFKAALQAEIEAKKKKLISATATGDSESKTCSSSSSAEPSARKNVFSVKRTDLERQEREEYLTKQRELEEHRKAKLDEKLAKLAKREVSASESVGQVVETVDEASNREIERKLKSHGHPIRLFGETDRQRMTRLKSIELREELLGGGERNDFSELLDLSDNEDSEEHDSKRMKNLRQVDNDGFQIRSGISEIEERIDRRLLAQDRRRTIELIGMFWKTLLREWKADLDARDEEERKSPAGKLATATQQQAVDHLKPFFRLLQRNELFDDLLNHIAEIIGYLQAREYIKASDTYLRMSIGNSPWPIGVTMVGIHERSAHEKITTGSVAHVLNDEVSRKWIQSVKRLMTVCQKLHPPSDLSKAMG